MFIEFAKDKDEWNEAYQIVINSLPKQSQSGGKEKQIENSNSCNVYLMFDKRTRKYKIGISITPEFREKTLQSEQPTIETIISKRYMNRRNAAIIEKALHEAYSHKRRRGEWFTLDKAELDEIKDLLS